MKPTAKQVSAILADLWGLGSERDRAGMARYGINVENACGVSIYDLRKIAKRLGTDQPGLAGGALGGHRCAPRARVRAGPGPTEEPVRPAITSAQPGHRVAGTRRFK